MFDFFSGTPRPWIILLILRAIKEERRILMDYCFSVGYSGGLINLNKLILSSSKIKSVYTGGVINKIAGGRPQYSNSLNELSQEVELANINNIDFELALNSPCGIEDKSNIDWWKDIRKYLKDIEKCGVNGIIASHPFIMEEVKAQTNMKLIVSTICEVTNSRTAMYYEKMGADIIIPSMNVNYNLEQLNCIKKSLSRASLRIMVNEHCLGDCPWRRFHHNYYAHSKGGKNDHYSAHCSRLMIKSPYLLLTNTAIRPEDLTKYMEITTDFKIVGRMIPIEKLVEIVTAYSKGYYNGNYVSLLDTGLSRIFYIDNNLLNDLFFHKIKCKNNCNECTYCIELYKMCSKRNNKA
jgi:collagenase-like PrtC family protease